METLVWIDAREATIVTWRDDEAHLEHVVSDVPAHHAATGQVRHSPTIRHGGTGVAQTAGEPHRLEHLRQFLDDVAGRLPARDDLLILGPGVVRERLEKQLRDDDRVHGVQREIVSERSPARTDRQLVARLRASVGAEAPRRTLGAYRWSTPPGSRRSGEIERPPRRIAPKRRERFPMPDVEESVID